MCYLSIFCKTFTKNRFYNRFCEVRTIVTTNRRHANTPAMMLNIDDNRKIAFRKSVGSKSPGLIFLPGFMSNMNGLKASLLNDFCVKHGHSYLSLDYESIGKSPGNFRDMHLGKWKEDVLAALDQLTTGPQLIVGSSMGAWLMLLVALERKERIHSLCSISAAINYTDRFYKSFPKELRDKIDSGEEVVIPGPYGNYPVTKTFLDETRKLYLPMDSPIPLHCPVRLMHSIQDNAAPFETSVLLSKLIESKDVEVHLRKDTDHKMSDPASLAMMVNILKELFEKN